MMYSRTSLTDPPCFIVGVVDDDQSMLDSFEILLESGDFAERPFASAAALLDSGCLAEIDCLISDIGMPVMDGRELAKVVRAPRPGLPIILVTGRPELLHRPPLDPGPYRVLTKPFNGQELLSAIAAAVRKAPARPPRS
jgi:FixJ family two-component response regulator